MSRTHRRARLLAKLDAIQARIDAIVDGPAVIPSLAPWGLEVVPAYRTNPATGEEDHAWRDEWFAWRDAVLEVRHAIQTRYRDDPAFRDEEVARCQSDPVWFVTMWLWVEEPRPDDENLLDDGDIDPLKPFIPYAPQVKVMQLFVAINEMPTRYDLLISKARGFGISFTFVAVAYWGWLFRHWRGRFLSQKMEKTDRAQDADSLFVKIDAFLADTPAEMIPAGFNVFGKRHRLEGMFKNPVTRAQLTSEATTTEAMRGGRATYAASDEVAFWEHYRKTRATIAGAADHRFDWSSESLVRGPQWQDTWQTAKRVNAKRREDGLRPVATVLEIEWYENPYQDAEWYARTKASFESDGNIDEFAVEYLRDAQAGYGTYVYPQVRSCPDTPLWYDKNRMLYGSVDPGMADDCAWVFWQNHLIDGKKRIRWLDMFMRNRLAAEVYAHILTGIPPTEDDPCIAYHYEVFADEQIQYFMRWLREVPSSQFMLFGDPAIESQDTGGSSFRYRFVIHSQEITEKAGLGLYAGRDLAQPHKAIYQRNNHPDRRFALRKGLMISEFSLSDGAQQLKQNIAQVRFGEMTEKTSRPPTTRHTRHTHPTTACEFGMLYDDLFLDVGEITPRVLEKPKSGYGRTPNHRRKDPYAQLGAA